MKYRLAGVMLASILFCVTGLGGSVAYSAGEGRDYLSAAGSEQCRNPKSDRVGAWVCVEDSGRGRIAAAGPGYCFTLPPNRGGGCWQNEERRGRSSFEGGGVYGYDSRDLGYVTVTTTDSINGSDLVNEHFSFRSDRGVSGLTMEIEPLFTNGEPVGIEFYQEKSHPNLNANSQVDYASMPGPRWNAFLDVNKYNQEFTIVHNVTWTDSEFPGRWFLYSKGVIIEPREETNSRLFVDPESVPDNAFGAGWRPV